MLNVADRPDTLDDTIQEINPDLHPQLVHSSRHTDGDVCIDSHARALFQCNAASQELSVLYNHNGAHVGTGRDARPQGHGVVVRKKQAHRPSSPIVPPRMKARVVTEPMLKTNQTLKYNT